MRKPDPLYVFFSFDCFSLLRFCSRPGLKLKMTDGVGHSEPDIQPRDRIILICEQVETTLEFQKAIDHQ